jgi:hypothetical protein
MRLDTPIKALIRFLLSEEPKPNYSYINNLLYNDTHNIVDVSEHFPEKRKVYINAFDLSVYSLELLEKTSNTVKNTIDDLEKQPLTSPFVFYLNGPFFNSAKKPILSIGRRKSCNSQIQESSPEYAPVDINFQISFPAMVLVDYANNVLIESKMASDAEFTESKFFFESTLLFIDKHKNINNFIESPDINEFFASKLPYASLGMPFLGISRFGNKDFLITITLENKGRAAFLKHPIATTFNTLSEISEAINIEKLVFLDGSDSLFVKYMGNYLFDLTNPDKDKDMPFFIGIRRK